MLAPRARTTRARWLHECCHRQLDWRVRAFLQLLLLGLLALHFSVCLFCWLQMPFDWLAVVMTFLVITSLAIELQFVRVTFAKFRLPSEQVVTGKFKEGRGRAPAPTRGCVIWEIRTLSNLIQEQSTAGAGADDPLKAKERVHLGASIIIGSAACGPGSAACEWIRASLAAATSAARYDWDRWSTQLCAAHSGAA